MPVRWTRRQLLALGGALPVAQVLGTACTAAAASDVVEVGPGGRSVLRADAALIPPPPPPIDVPFDAADVALTPRPEGERLRAGQPDFGLAAYDGLGCWVDVFDWAFAYASGGVPPIGPAQVRALAARGVRTLYLQTARYDRPDGRDDVLERDRIWAITDAAHAAGMQVVAWYLPMHTDPVLDTRRCLAALSDTSFDGFALDIESRAETDVALRNRRLVALVGAVRDAAGPRATLGGIVVPPTTTEDVNPNYWPDFPWRELTTTLDVFLPMNYWTNRLSSSPWRDAARSTAENIRRLRRHAGRADLPVHVVGGIADRVTVEEVAAMVRAAQDEGAAGVSLYDLATTGADLWPALR